MFVHCQFGHLGTAAMKKLSAIAFPGGFNLPIWTAIDNGFFERQGIELDLRYTANSVEQMTALIDGDVDVGLTGFDNIVAYQEGQGEAATSRAPDLFAFMGGDDAFLRLVVQPSIGSYAALRGTTLSVDAMTTGFAFVLRRMLAANGIAETEVTFERAGGVMQRFEALKAGKHSGTLLVTPFELIAARMGMKTLHNARDVTGPYQGISGVARRGWAAENRAVLVGFIRAYVQALDWLFEPSNLAAAASLLASRVPNMGADLAAATCGILLSEHGGFERRARLVRRGVWAVLGLRSEYGLPRKSLTDSGRYEDQSYYAEATAADRR